MVEKDAVSVNSLLVPKAPKSNPRYSVLIGLADVTSIEGGEVQASELFASQNFGKFFILRYEHLAIFLRKSRGTVQELTVS